MATKSNINEDVKNIIDSIITKCKLAEDANVTYSIGSEKGDGFLSDNVAVSICDDDQCLEVFLKCGLEKTSSSGVPLHNLYANEIHFYDVILPAFLTFLEEKNAKDSFKNVPICYGTSKKNIIALENVTKKGYVLCEKAKPLNDEHITIVLKTFAKLHAISFAYKDQRKEEYNKIMESIYSIVYDEADSDRRKKLFGSNIENFLAALDPIKDKHILDRTDGLLDKLYAVVLRVYKQKSEDSILTQGDCWCNNMMFLYKDQNKKHPEDVILLDWQIIRQTLPVFDLSYFFYSVASQEALDNLKHYLKVYHEELSRQIRELGSDPDILYPFSLLEKQWKENSKFGLNMAFILLRIMLSEKDEVVDFANIDFKTTKPEDLFPSLKNEEEYFRRLKILMEHMINNDFL